MPDDEEYSGAIATLPHGDLLKLVDQVIDTDRKGWITTRTEYRLDNPLVEAHATLGGTVAGICLVEQAAQTALVLGNIVSASRDRTALLSKVKARFLLPVIAPRSVECHLLILHKGQDHIGFSATLKDVANRFATVSGVCSFVEQ